MTICLHERTGTIHIIGWTTHKGNHYTLCDRFFKKDLTMQTLALDNSFNGVCKNCHITYDAMYKDDLNFFTRLAHGQLHEDLSDHFREIERGFVKISHIFDFLQNKQQWSKLAKYQRLLNRK